MIYASWEHNEIKQNDSFSLSLQSTYNSNKLLLHWNWMNEIDLSRVKPMKRENTCKNMIMYIDTICFLHLKIIYVTTLFYYLPCNVNERQNKSNRINNNFESYFKQKLKRQIFFFNKMFSFLFWFLFTTWFCKIAVSLCCKWTKTSINTDNSRALD